MNEIYTVSGNKVKFTNSDYIATGGEGILYAKGSLVYKIYIDPGKIIPASKVQELNKLLDKDNILKPINEVHNDKGVYVGFTMKRVSDTSPLCKLFTNDFRKANNVTPSMICNLVERLLDDINYIHKKKCLIVDCNEFNFLVEDKTFKIPYFIDVNSYQTPSFPATAIMPNIRDYHTKTFSDLTDWFSFAIIACQLFIGIHPFKGRHPNFKQNDFVERMKKNISIFNKDVTVPAATRDFGLIPNEYKKWFIKLFEKGERVPPPSLAGIMQIAPQIVIVQSTNTVDINLISEYNSDIRKVFSYNGNIAVVAGNELYLNKLFLFTSTDPDIQISFYNNFMIIVENDNGLDFKSIRLKPIKVKQVGNQYTNIKASNKFVSDNKIYITYDNKFLELQVTDMGEQVIVSTANGVVREFLSNSSKVFDGVIYQDTLGFPYLLIPYRNKKNIPCCMIKAFNELKGYKIISGKNDLGVCMIIGFDGNKYDKFIFKFDDDYEKYSCRIINDISYMELNFVTLDNGIVAHISDDEELEIFSKSPNQDKLRIVKDPQIKTDVTLYKSGVTVMFTKGNKLFSMKLK